eukprot:1095974-Prymnesium_polylepis.1
MASRGPRSGPWLCTLRGLQLRGRRAVGSMEIAHLHAADRSAVIRAAHPVRAYDPALQSRWPAASRGERTSPTTSSTAERSCTTSL